MTLEHWPHEPRVCLRHPDGGAYCGEMCFGFGLKATSDPKLMTCSLCKFAYQKELRKSKGNDLDPVDGHAQRREL